MAYASGCYYLVPFHDYHKRIYLFPLRIKAHTSILSSISRTVLTQEFENTTPSLIGEVRYTFPLYDGVSVVGFTCRVGNRVIAGLVEERQQARIDYEDATARGETAGLFEQLPSAADVFTTTIGNIPAGSKLSIELTYLGELKHDAEVDGVRFTIPTRIAPRYGTSGLELASRSPFHFADKAMEFVVDIAVAEGSFIRSVRSPSHPIEVSLGTTSLNPDTDPKQHLASATLGLRDTALDKDFVVQIVAKDTGVPRALLETHMTLPGYRALMATLVPKFNLPSIRPEVVFVCDRSGSMRGKMDTVIASLRVFLKSLPVGVNFNICSFGSRHSFLWEKSKLYNKTTLDTALQHIETFSSNFGGTEMLQPISGTIQRRHTDIPLEICLLTDGQIHNQDKLFQYLNDQVATKKLPIRVFTLGIGQSVSHALIEGLARAGRGFSQSVLVDEKLDSKVVRMLKGALTPHIDDYTLEVKYGSGEAELEEEDFEIIEKVNDTLAVRLEGLDMGAKVPQQKKPISLYNDATDMDDGNDESKDIATYLPGLSPPKLLQTPFTIPPLFPFIRTAVYLLMSPDSMQKTPKSVVLRGTCEKGPLELEIPVQSLETPGETIHQLAAKKAVQELEEGRGWIFHATDDAVEDANQSIHEKKLLSAKYASKFEGLVEQEAARLGTTFQVGGKFCSFVAVEGNNATTGTVDDRPALAAQALRQNLYDLSSTHQSRQYYGPSTPTATRLLRGRSAVHAAKIHLEPTSGVFSSATSGSESPSPPMPLTSFSLDFSPPPLELLQFGTGASWTGQPDHSAALQAERMNKPTFDDEAQPAHHRAPLPSTGAFGSSHSRTSVPTTQHEAKFDGMGNTLRDIAVEKRSMGASFRQRMGSRRSGIYRRETQVSGPLTVAVQSSAPGESQKESIEEGTERAIPSDHFQALVHLQTFEGSWEYHSQLFAVLKVSEQAVEKLITEKLGWKKDVFATILTILYFKIKMAEREEDWELLVEKAEGWVGETEKLEITAEMESAAKELLA